MKNILLRRARLQKGWSQQQLADFAEIGITTVARAESGKSLRIDNIQRLCACLEKTPEQLGLVKLDQQQEGSDQRGGTRTFYRDGETIGEAKEDTLLPPVKLTPEQIAPLLQLLALGDITMAHFDPQRRAALLHLLSTASMLSVVPQTLADPDPEPWERLTTALATPSNLNAATLQHFETLTATCWELSNAGQLQMAEQVLASFLPRFLQLAPSHTQAASLASQGLRLQSILAAHRLKLADKVTLSQQAVIYAKQASDYPTLVAALIELAVAFHYTQHYEDMLKASQEMLSYSRYIPPLLQARAYIIAAEAFSHCGRTREAEFYIQLAYETFPDHSEYDLQVHANANILIMGLYEGLAYLSQGKGDKAFATFGGKLFEGRLTGYQSTSVLPERIRLEITNHQGQAAILSNNLEEYARCLEEGLSGAIALKSQKRFHEAMTIFRQEVPAKWRNEPQLKDIAERFQLVG
ncbi:MAG TPA: helix-turn-helix transcriptional regulator [Ktedonosporobacter sp.]|jgi:transcriptional regulator with XRE-family HTH domain|nr:helix-turn-helix transcriptional regulator [Ktedonosporobacter sp.]